MKLFKKIDHSKFLFLLTMLVIIVPNIALSFTESLSLVQRFANIFLPLGIYWLLMAWSPKVGRSALFMFPIMFLAAFQIVLLWLYGRSAISVDMWLNIETTNSVEAGELLGNMVPVLIAVFILYLPPLTLGVIGIIKRWRLKSGFIRLNRRVGIVLTVIGAILFTCSFFSRRSYDPTKDLYPVNVIYNVCLASERKSDMKHYYETSAGYTFNASPTHPAADRELYILVVGETSRACNWQMFGYNRPTTEPLNGISGLIGYGKAISQSNTTHKSVPMLLSGVDAREFGDSINYVKSVITAFKEAGFRTAFFSNQRRNHSYIDFFGEEADTCLFLKDDVTKDMPDPLDDELLLCVQNEIARNAPKELIVLHTYGSHYCYNDRYSDTDALFTPDKNDGANFKNKPLLVNSYDNTIRYTAKFLASLIKQMQADSIQASLVYTSDHGEDIYDDSRRLFLHASPCPSYYQVHVPFLVWMSDAYREAHPATYAAARSNMNMLVSSSTSFFYTALDLAGIKSPRRDDTHSVVSPDYKMPELLYLNDHNEAVPLLESGITKLDIEKLNKVIY
jgi:glucan phosphoethanolaminetransferase (alkaline phosphatase superfamily)